MNKVFISIVAAILIMACTSSDVSSSNENVSVDDGFTLISMVALLSDPWKFENKRVSLGGYLGTSYFAPGPALFFTSEHISIPDLKNEIVVSSLDKTYFLNYCDNIGDYVNVIGLYSFEYGLVASEIRTVKKASTPIISSECEETIKQYNDFLLRE